MKITMLLLLAFYSVPLWSADKTLKIKEDSLYEQRSYKTFIGSSNEQKIKITAKEWSSWIVEKAVENRLPVKKGDILVQFKKDKFNNALEKKQRDLRLQQLNLEKQKLVVKQTQIAAEKELELVKLKADLAEKAELLYKTTGRKKYIESLNNDVADMEKNLKYQMSELDQLQKMYTQDSLKEESEEIVLQRQKDMVDRAHRYVEMRKKIRAEALALKLPLNDFNKSYNKEKAEAAVQKAKVDWQTKILTEQNKLIDAEMALSNALEKLDELSKDGENLEIKAEFDGVAHIAAFNDGKWSSSHNNILKKDAKVSNEETFMTVVGKQGDQVQIAVPEGDIGIFEKDTVAYLSVKGRRYPLTKGEKDTVAKNGFYKVTYKLPKLNKYYGMPVDVKVVSKLADKCISIPLDALRYKNDAPEKAYVVLKRDGKKEDIYVTLGESVGDKVVISKGLNAGETIILP